MTQRKGRWLLDLADLFGGAGAHAADTVARLGTRTRWPSTPRNAGLVSFDTTSWLTLRDHLEAGGVVGADGRIDTARAVEVATQIEAVCDAVAIATSRLPPPTSRLVVTATASEDLASLRATLGVGSLYELIERTVRSAARNIVLGSPYWNEAALGALTPAIGGALDRGCALDLIVQAGRRRPSQALDRVTAWAATLQAAHGLVTVWHFDADNLSERHIQLHAKFALADDASGYLGSANLTDQGFEVNFEIGAALGAGEVVQLRALLDELRGAGMLTAR